MEKLVLQETQFEVVLLLTPAVKVLKKRKKTTSCDIKC
jgi:hypothetical protein